MDIGSLICNERLSRGWTQFELSRRTSVSLPTIQNLEAHKGNPSWSTLLQIFEALDLKISIKSNRDVYPLTSLISNSSWLHKKSPSQILKDAFANELAQMSEGSIDLRQAEVILGAVSALRDHFPTWVKKNRIDRILKQITEHLRNPDMNRLIKFRRLWIDRLSDVL